MKVLIKPLPAKNGDSLLIRYEKSGIGHNILIDGGNIASYRKDIRKIIQGLSDQKEVIDLLVISHIDGDHIGGILHLISDMQKKRRGPDLTAMVKQFWFNSHKNISAYFANPTDENLFIELPRVSGEQISVKQGNKVENFLAACNKWHDEPIRAGQRFQIEDCDIRILSPNQQGLEKLNNSWETELLRTNTKVSGTKSDHRESISALREKEFEEDDGIPNGSSIAFLVELYGKKILMLADSHPSVVAASLREWKYSPQAKLPLDCMKISHHGSRKNTSEELLELISCQNYIISSDGINSYGHPSKECLVRIICSPSRDVSKPIKFYFNYRTPNLQAIFSKEEEQAYNFHCIFPPKDSPAEIVLP
ncbi:MAG: MBL fold metallo-hydrolase [Bacteroidota bacterium]